ncbi:efflux RND transporter periplasmic adaptor subunit [Maribellus comscasis]|uniref:Efflux RND transporter periplasmic adaptor subunit n=1 Tax=Maribellus comscasis TaxID=2681766 RepID=A0A6I6JVR7_9BACT|nr:efflux RND transporter periplasmic adaptor subunit [Maribellus comscasis]QGY46671.1 efflux RND transporter periplasmic adaptor subunit [Maribellus comscasis]
MRRLNIYTTMLFALPAVLFSCTEKPAENTSEGVQKAKKEVVRETILTEEEISRSIEYSSTFEPFEEVHLAPASPGKIESIPVEIGDKVSKDQVLIKMDDTQLLQSKIQMNNLQTDFSRLDTLRKVGSIAQQQYDQMEAQYEVAQKNVKHLADNTTITAPFSGVISGKYFENGEMYSGSPIASVGKAAIVSLIQIDKLKAIVSISEKYFPNVKKGMEAKIRVDVYPDMEFSGKIYRIYPTINPQSRSFDVEVSIDNSKNLLRPGMFSRISIDLEETNALVLPAVAVLKMQGSNVRYLFVNENGKAKRIEVELGKRFDDKVEVISNELKVGDKVIVNGQARLLDGVEIEVVN